MLTTKPLRSDLREEIHAVRSYLNVTRDLLAGFDSDWVLEVSRLSALLEPACAHLARIEELLE